MTRAAAIDIGTNTVRLLVCDEKLTHVERRQRITRLGKGVDASGSLTRDSMERTLDAVRTFVDRARELGAERIRIAATSAMRDASNAVEFAAAVRDATGISPEVFDGRTEGRCAYRGATSWLGSGEFAVCDIGGGSTELITAERDISVDVGSVRVRERFFPSDPPGADEIESARTFVTAAVADIVGFLGLEGDEQLVGVAGTITTLAALVAGLTTYDSERVHGSRIGRDVVRGWSNRLLGLSADEITALGPVEPGRADVIGAGVLILSVVMDALDAPDVLVSERDILDGLVADLVR